MNLLIFLALLPVLAAPLGCAAGSNLVANGSFELSQIQSNRPDHWAASGNVAIQQKLGLDTGRDGARCAKLECTEFAGEGPDLHAMICQMGKVSVRPGQWYRLTFWAKAEGIKRGWVEVALTHMRGWEDVGLAEAFTPRPQWERFEFLFRARADLPAATSRLQFWFKSTGTLWLDEVVLSESADPRQWFPQIATSGVKNWLPNSSFECGPANWGSFAFGLSNWGGNLYRLEGELDRAVASHGRHSLKIALTPKNLPVFHFDYYEPVRQPVRSVLVANQGWFRITPGEKMTLSAYLRADADGVMGQMAVNEAPHHLQHQPVTLSSQWRRYSFTFTPTQPFLFIAIGLDLESSRRDSATLWVDSIQLERGEQATLYEPRLPVESFIVSGSADNAPREAALTGGQGRLPPGGNPEQPQDAPIGTGIPGNVFTNAESGLAFTILGFNDTDEAQTVHGEFSLTDFFGRLAFRSQPKMVLPAHSDGSVTLSGIGRGKHGFFRANWMMKAPAHSPSAKVAPACSATQSLRCALIDPVAPDAADSPFGFNHAYPWDFLVQLARQAGIVWWRDWSAKWQTVEPAKGRFDFSVPDTQIQRLLKLGNEVEVLLPFPSASWSTTARLAEVEKAAGNSSYLRTRLPLAFAPCNGEDFGHYAAAVLRHYLHDRPRGVTTYQILNEPIYTTYALPRQFGYGLNDYLKLLETAYRAMRTAGPNCRIVGGISASVESTLTRQFVTQGGLRFTDVLDVHIYDPPCPLENYAESFSALEALMRDHGGPKPVWITEWGCYADDDPACFPPAIGDVTMNRCRWPNERAATEHIVKFTATAFAYGVRKIFFHAGTGGTINGPDAGGVLFEYGGAPRKMYAGVSALTRLLGVPETLERKVERDDLRAYLFRVKDRVVAVAWGDAGQCRALKLASGVIAYDIMGNPLATDAFTLSESPLYLAGPNAEAVLEAISP